MYNGPQRLYVFILVKRDVVIAAHRVSNSTIGKLTFAQNTLAKSSLSTTFVYSSMFFSVPAMMISSTCLAVSRFFLISNSGSYEVGLRLNAIARLLNSIQNARGASLVPVPGLMHWRQWMDSSNVSNPGGVRRIDALPGGSLKHTTLGFSLVAAASSSYEKTFRNALSMSKDAMIQSGWRSASLVKVR